ncbi:MAG TPA: hypothetical protein VF587_09455 [Solirubrobacteraceae bacterium]|jgi:hypothetical protein
MRHGSACLTALLLALAAPSAALAEHSRSVPAGVNPGTPVSDANFVVHYDPSTSTQAAAEALLADLATSRARLVAGGGGTPNAGLADAVDDADGKTDVYLSAPSNQPGFQGGTVYDDTAHSPRASYMFLTPEMDRDSTRFRTAHEFMHVLQNTYTPGIGGLLTESSANWATEWVFPDQDPLDSNFPQPFVPLDCSYGTFTVSGEGSARNCGFGYWQWSFLWRLTQWYGVGIIDQLLDEMAADCTSGCSTAIDRGILADVIAAQPDAETLATRYSQYARDVWVPARWSSSSLWPTTAMQAIHDYWGTPAATVVTAATTGGDTGTIGVNVDRLATRYVRVRNDGGYDPTGPSDELEITIGRPTGQAAPFRAVARWADGTQTDTFELAGPGGGSIGTTADPASLKQVVLPLTNDMTTTQGFSYRVRYIRGQPTPPPNDLQANALAIPRGIQAETDNVYAGGRGNVDEATECTNAQDATRGTWSRYTTEGAGLHTYNATASDFAAVVALYRHDNGEFAGCANGSFSGVQPAGTTYDVYVGRRASNTGFGTAARLTVAGPGPGPPTVTATSPADGATVATRRPTFSGTAGTRAGDGTTVTVKIWQGNDVAAAPLQTLTTQRSGAAWQVAATADLPNGFYLWRAEQAGTDGTGVSEYRSLGVQVSDGDGGSGSGGAGEDGTGNAEPLDSGNGLTPGGGVVPGPTGAVPVDTDFPPETSPGTCSRARSALAAAKRKLTAAKRSLRKAKGARRKRSARRRVAKAKAGVRRATARRNSVCA